MGNLSTAWLQSTSTEEKAKFKELIFNHRSNAVLLRLKEMVVLKRQNLENLEMELGTYDDASWSHKQAHINGARQTLKMIEDLLSFTE